MREGSLQDPCTEMFTVALPLITKNNNQISGTVNSKTPFVCADVGICVCPCVCVEARGQSLVSFLRNGPYYCLIFIF